MSSLRWLLLCAVPLCAQDPFEIHVFEYEPLPRGAFTYEAHLNYGATPDQFHVSSELTAGLTEQFRAAVVVMTALRPDHSLDYAGLRLAPHWYAPPSWHLPVNLGLVAEFSFQRLTYLDNARQIELRPIIEKHIGRLELDGNPVVEHSTREGWVFEPAARIGWRTSPTFTPSLEYCSSLGPQQIHQIFPGGDLKLGDHLRWSFGVGVGATSAGSRVILKSRFEWSFGRTAHD